MSFGKGVNYQQQTGKTAPSGPPDNLNNVTLSGPLALPKDYQDILFGAKIGMPVQPQPTQPVQYSPPSAPGAVPYQNNMPAAPLGRSLGQMMSGLGDQSASTPAPTAPVAPTPAPTPAPNNPVAPNPNNPGAPNPGDLMDYIGPGHLPSEMINQQQQILSQHPGWNLTDYGKAGGMMAAPSWGSAYYTDAQGNGYDAQGNPFTGGMSRLAQ